MSELSEVLEECRKLIVSLDDPALKPLLRVLQVESPCVGNVAYGVTALVCHQCMVHHYQHRDWCSEYQGSGLTLRDWDRLPPGALRGAIYEALDSPDCKRDYVSAYQREVDGQMVAQHIKEESKVDTNLASAKALLVALGKRGYQ